MAPASALGLSQPLKDLGVYIRKGLCLSKAEEQYIRPVAKQTSVSRFDCAQKGAVSLPVAVGRTSGMAEPMEGLRSAGGTLGGKASAVTARQHKLSISTARRAAANGHGLTPVRVSDSGASSGACWILLMAQLVPKDMARVSGAPSPPRRGSPYLPCLRASPCASRLCRCGRLRETGKDNQTGGHSSRERVSGAGPRVPAALPAVTCEKWCLPFFFHPVTTAGVRLGTAEGGEGCSGSQWGQVKGGEPRLL